MDMHKLTSFFSPIPLVQLKLALYGLALAVVGTLVAFALAMAATLIIV
jgi:hypothetical protein